MEEDVKVTKTYTHKVVDLGNGGVCIFTGSYEECNEYVNRNQLEDTDLVIGPIYNIL